MDNSPSNAQQPNSQTTNPVSTQPVSTPQNMQNVSPVPSNPPAPVSPSSINPTASYIPSSHPEAGGAIPVQENPYTKISPSETQPQLHPEVQKAGVEIISQTPPITPSQQAVGVQPAKETVPVSTTPTDLIQIPIPQLKAEQIIKEDKNPGDSKLWLATLILRELHAAALREQQKVPTVSN